MSLPVTAVGICQFCQNNYLNNRKAKAEQNACIIETDSSKIHLVILAMCTIARLKIIGW